MHSPIKDPFAMEVSLAYILRISSKSIRWKFPTSQTQVSLSIETYSSSNNPRKEVSDLIEASLSDSRKNQ